jgi:hypothetical protein
VSEARSRAAPRRRNPCVFALFARVAAFAAFAMFVVINEHRGP